MDWTDLERGDDDTDINPENWNKLVDKINNLGREVHGLPVQSENSLKDQLQRIVDFLRECPVEIVRIDTHQREPNTYPSVVIEFKMGRGY